MTKQEKKFLPGEIVKHKLTGEKMIVLSSEGYGATHSPVTRVRATVVKTEERWFEDTELEKLIIKKKI